MLHFQRNYFIIKISSVLFIYLLKNLCRLVLDAEHSISHKLGNMFHWTQNELTKSNKSSFF